MKDSKGIISPETEGEKKAGVWGGPSVKGQFVVVYKMNQGNPITAAHNKGPQGEPHLQPINRIIRSQRGEPKQMKEEKRKKM